MIGYSFTAGGENRAKRNAKAFARIGTQSQEQTPEQIEKRIEQADPAMQAMMRSIQAAKARRQGGAA